MPSFIIKYHTSINFTTIASYVHEIHGNECEVKRVKRRLYSELQWDKNQSICTRTHVIVAQYEFRSFMKINFSPIKV